MSNNIELKPVALSQFDEIKNTDNLFLAGYTDQAGGKKNVRIHASSFIKEGHAKAYAGDILESKAFSLSSSEEMYHGQIKQDVVLSEVNASSCYGTLYLFITNNTEQEYSLTLPEDGYYFFPQDQKTIIVPSKNYIELAIKAYGEARVVTNLSGLDEEELEYLAGENIIIKDYVISAKDTVYDDAELRSKLKGAFVRELNKVELQDGETLSVAPKENVDSLYNIDLKTFAESQKEAGIKLVNPASANNALNELAVLLTNSHQTNSAKVNLLFEGNNFKIMDGLENQLILEPNEAVEIITKYYGQSCVLTAIKLK